MHTFLVNPHSSGIGRTGTYTAISLALEQATAEGMVDIAGIINRMRQQRMKMVQSPVRKPQSDMQFAARAS